ncbi:MAG: sugar phosphate isomerase/epimerase, partial [Clostridiales bacterium]
MIQYGITQWALPGEGIYAIRHVAEMGFDGMQLEVGAYAKGYYMSQKSIRDAYLEDGEKYGIQFPSIVLNDLMVNGFVKPRGSEQYKIAQETMELGLEIAKYMKIDDVMIPQFWGNEITDDETFEQTVEELGRFCKKAAEAGIHVESET